MGRRPGEYVEARGTMLVCLPGLDYRFLIDVLRDMQGVGGDVLKELLVAGATAYILQIKGKLSKKDKKNIDKAASDLVRLATKEEIHKYTKFADRGTVARIVRKPAPRAGTALTTTGTATKAATKKVFAKHATKKAVKKAATKKAVKRYAKKKTAPKGAKKTVKKR